MLKIEFKNVGNEIKTIVDVKGKDSDVVSEIICFYNDHTDILKELIDKLPMQLQLNVLLGLLEGYGEKDD